MTKTITSYFKSENDAESARIRLQSLRVEKVLLDHMPEGEHELTFIPVLPTSTGSIGPGVAAVQLPEDENSVIDGNDDRMTHLIEAEVREEDYEKAMTIIKESHGYKDSRY